ncbi:MAG: aminotransferase class III-fold pyridoxal phosphate-dependent enzyme [Actinomycetota bacterium]
MTVDSSTPAGALLHPFADPTKAEGDFINIVSAEGTTLTDDTGKQYLDGMASLWYCQVGHGRREIIDAVTTQLNTLDTYNIFDPFTNERAREAAALIASKSPHPDGRVFLGCSGSEAVDTALKLSRLVQQRRGLGDKQIIVRRTHGYHGTNFGGTSAQGISPNREGWGDLVPHFVEIANDNVEEAASLFAEHGDRIAAVMCEPVQGAGGVWPPEDGYLQGLRRLCDQHGSLLIFDEVICGFGRTGSWFGAQTFGVTPDLMTFAKGVTSGYQPLSGVIVSADAAADLGTDDHAILRHGYTYSGHPAAAAAGVANIQLIDDEGLVDRANHVGKKTVEGLDALAADGMIKGYRGVGAMWAADIGRDSIPIKNTMLADGVIIRAVGEAIIWCPPLTVTDDEVGRYIETLQKALS